jgi:hypothetical protein
MRSKHVIHGLSLPDLTMSTHRDETNRRHIAAVLSRLLDVMVLITLERTPFRKSSPAGDQTDTGFGAEGHHDDAVVEDEGYEVPEPTVAFGIVGRVLPDDTPHEETPEVIKDRKAIAEAVKAEPLPDGKLPKLYA